MMSSQTKNQENLQENEIVNLTTFVFTDGGAKNNGRKNCKAAWGVFFADNDPRNEAGEILIDPSNQKAELYAIKMALEKTNNVSDVTIVTDSQYSRDWITKWWRTWEKNGWKTYKKEPVKHSTLIKECVELSKCSDERKITWKHVNSHQVPPRDINSFEYFMWNGNFSVDKMLKNVINNNGDLIVSKVFGKSITVDWEGNICTDKNKVSSAKKRKMKSKKEIPRKVVEAII